MVDTDTMTPFGVASAGDMCQRKLDMLFQGLPIMLGIAEDILTAGSTTKAQSMTLHSNRVLRICRQTYLNIVTPTSYDA